MISSGLAKLGYTQINIDEGWLKGRYPNGTIYEVGGLPWRFQ